MTACRNLSLKAVAVSMVTAVLLPSALITGCKKKDDIISSDTPWYSLNKFSAGKQYLDDNLSHFHMAYTGRLDDKLVFMTSGMYMEERSGGYDPIAGTFERIDIYGLDGTLINSIDVTPYCADVYSELGDSCVFSYGASVRDDNIIFTVCNTDFILDAGSGELISSQTSAEDDTYLYSEREFELGGYDVVVARGDGYNLIVTDENGDSYTADISDIADVYNMQYVDNMIYAGDGRAVIKVSDGYNDNYYTFDLQNGNLQDYTDEAGWLRDDFDRTNYIEGTGSIVINEFGIKLLDFGEHQKREVFNFDWCNINRYDASGVTLLDMTEDTIIMSGEHFNGNSYYSDPADGSLEIYILTRQDENPNTGKRKIVAATLDTFDYALCEAVCAFNNEDPDYFICLESKYSTLARYMNSELDFYSDNREEEYLASSGELSDMLMMDLISGNGPDIILNGGEYTQLNNDQCLMDLSESLDGNGLFTNMIEAAQTDGKLYQLPLAADISGLVVRTSGVTDDQSGFTYEQYGWFVSDICNGADPMGSGKLDFFMETLPGIMQDLITDNISGFDNDEFRMLAAFVNDNVNERIEIDEEGLQLAEEFTGNLRDATYYRDLTFGRFIHDHIDRISDVRVVGLPSPDGRGPGLIMDSSFAIAASTESKEACESFMRTLLSDDIQYDFGYYDGGTPVRISSAATAMNDIIDGYNDLYDRYNGYYSPTELRLLNLPHEHIDQSTVDGFISMIESCSFYTTSYPSAMMIVREEIPAYLASDKTLDEVIAIIDDRVQTLLDERR